MTPLAATSPTRLHNVQALRFLAAALVLHAHAVDAAQRIQPGTRPLLGAGTLGDLGAIGVDIFFVISGFIITRTAFAGGKARPAVDFAWARLKRVVPLYFITTSLWLFAPSEFSFHPGALVSTFLFWPVADGRFVEPIHPVGWTLCYEMLFYAAMTLVLLVPKMRVARVILITFLVCLLLSFFMDSAVMRHLGNPIILEFLAGVAIALWLPPAVGRRTGWTALALFGLCIAGLLAFGYGQVSEAYFTQSGELSLARAVLFGVPASLILVAGVALEPRTPTLRPRLVSRALTHGGDASYAIYLSHPATLALLIYWGPPLTSDGIVLAGILAGIVGGLVVHHGIERPLALSLAVRQPVNETKLIRAAARSK